MLIASTIRVINLFASESGKVEVFVFIYYSDDDARTSTRDFTKLVKDKNKRVIKESKFESEQEEESQKKRRRT